jgi:hypothetical protein
MTSKRNTPKYFYTVQEWRTESRDYHAILIRIWQPAQEQIDRLNKNGFASSWDYVEIKFQGNHNEPNRWYAPDVSVYNPEYVQNHVNAIRILKAVSKDDYLDAEHIITTLESCGQYLVDDPRLGHLTNRLFSADYTGWMDDYTAYNAGSGCNVRVLATSEEDAKLTINREYIKACANGYMVDGDRYTAWVNAGRPVKEVRYTWGKNTPDRRTPREMLAQQTDDR